MSGAALENGPAALHPLYTVVNVLCRPEFLFTLSMVGFFAALKFRRFLVKPVVAVCGLTLFLIFFGLSMLHPHFREQAVKPDNVPIWLLLLLTGGCLYMAFYQAVNNDTRFANGLRSDEHEAAEEKLHVWPYLLYIEAIVAAFVLAVLFLWSVTIEAPLEQFANIAKTPNPSKAPWYFLGLQEMLVYFDPWIAGVVLPSLILSGLIAIPYCDPNPKGVGYFTFEQRKIAITVYLFGFLLLWVLLIFIGTFLRGQNWNFFGLFEPWDAHKLLSLNNKNLSDFFWQDWLGKATPTEWWRREWPGILLIVMYFGIPMAVLPKLLKATFQKMGMVRFQILLIHGLIMFALPIKMYLRWMVNLKYVVFIPDFFLNV